MTRYLKKKVSRGAAIAAVNLSDGTAFTTTSPRTHHLSLTADINWETLAAQRVISRLHLQLGATHHAYKNW